MQTPQSVKNIATKEAKSAPKQTQSHQLQQSLGESSMRREGIQRKLAQMCSKKGDREGGMGHELHVLTRNEQQLQQPYSNRQQHQPQKRQPQKHRPPPQKHRRPKGDREGGGGNEMHVLTRKELQLHQPYKHHHHQSQQHEQHEPQKQQSQKHRPPPQKHQRQKDDRHEDGRGNKMQALTRKELSRVSASVGQAKKSRLFSRSKLKPSNYAASPSEGLSLSKAMEMRAKNSLRREALFKIFERKSGSKPVADTPGTSVESYKSNSKSKDVSPRKKEKAKQINDAISRGIKDDKDFIRHVRSSIYQASTSFVKDKDIGDHSRVEIIETVNEPVLEDPLKQSALKFSKATTHVDRERKMAVVSDAWNFLCGPADEQAGTSEFLPLKGKILDKYEKERGRLQSSSAGTTVANSDLNDLKESISSGDEIVQPSKVSDQQTTLNRANIFTTLASLQDNVTRLLSDVEGKSEYDPQELQVGLKQPLRKTIARLEEKLSTVKETVPEQKEFGGNIDEPEAIEISDSDSSDSSSSDDDDREPFHNPERKIIKRRRRRGLQSHYCAICEKSYHKLDRHMLTHTSERTFKCEECGKAFYESRVLQKHLTTHIDKYKCGICGEAFSKVRAAKRHAKTHLPEKPYVCNVCKAKFRTRSELRKHMVAHVAVKRYMCDLCGHGVRSKTALTTHMRSHTGEKPYICETCGKSFRYSSGLRVHSFTHTSGKPYRCVLCNESFAHNYLLKRHRVTHEEQSSEAIDYDEYAQDAMNAPSQILNSVSSDFHPQDHLENLNAPYPLPSLPQSFQEQAPFAPQMEPSVPSEKSNISHTEEVHTTSYEPNSELPPPEKSAPQVSQSYPVSVHVAPLEVMHSTLKTPQTEFDVPQVHQSVPSDANVPVLGDQSSRANDTIMMEKFLGMDMLQENLIYGSGSRKQTVQDSIVVPLCDGSYKALKQLQAQMQHN